jgi:hypothetical protein
VTPSGSRLLQWSWHHFRPLGRADNYQPILKILAAHEGEAVEEAREAVNEEVGGLGLKVGLGQRKNQSHPNIFRDRFDVWRFTGAVIEPGLVDETIQLTQIGHLLLEQPDSFARIMARQALRLSYPRIVRIRRESEVQGTVEELEKALSLGPGVNVVRAWGLAVGHLRERGAAPSISGEKAIRFLSGIASLDEVPDRVEELLKDQTGLPSKIDDVSDDRKRQGRELEVWLTENGALAKTGKPAFSLDPGDREFQFKGASSAELLRWNQWWGAVGG